MMRLRMCIFSTVFVLLSLITVVINGKPTQQPNFFSEAIVDHDPYGGPYTGRTWTQRFYMIREHFRGAGSPIFLILGGESASEPGKGVIYPFIAEHLAISFGAFVLKPEHRFYGYSQPISREEISRARKRGKQDPRVRLLTSDQALHDAIRLVRYVRDRLKCSRDKFSSRYCPVITVGGSYAGFLSAMARLRFPSVVDMAYASSAPMKFYAQSVEPFAYYDHITAVADKTLPGCAAAVRSSLDDVVSYYRKQHNVINASMIGACEGTLPSYIQDTQTFVDETMMMVGYTFANANMVSYPPSNATPLYNACQTFVSKNSNRTSMDKLSQFLVNSLSSENDSSCFDMQQQLPTGPNATISGGDWSGIGTGPSGESWDFQTCTLLVEKIGFGNNSMFPQRSWTLEWLTEHCRMRFGVTPHPTELVERWHFDDLVAADATRILFTNGLEDGWSVSGIQTNLSDSLLALNFANAAHHSDLSYGGPPGEMTEDIKQGRAQIQTILAEWLAELPGWRIKN